MTALHLTFSGDGHSPLGGLLKERVEAHLHARGLSGKANRVMWARAALILGTTLAAYATILTNRCPPLAMLGLAMVIGVGLAGIGFCIAHDAIHGAVSFDARVNRLLGLTLDLCGGSSYMWRLGHNVVHHTYTNIPGVDGDVAGSAILRQSPHAPWRPCHRYQHLYAFPLYSLATLNWVFLKDYKDAFERHWGTEHDKVHPRSSLAAMLGLKAVHYGWSLVVPLMVLRIAWWQVLVGYVAMHLTAGLILGVVFQLAHIVEGTTFPKPDAGGVVRDEWIAHQLATTANFANGNRLLTWYVGGLNHQIEHHLFPRVCSVHYAGMAAIVRDAAQAAGLPYQHQPTLRTAILSHYRLLKRLGEAGPANAAA